MCLVYNVEPIAAWDLDPLREVSMGFLVAQGTPCGEGLDVISLLPLFLRGCSCLIDKNDWERTGVSRQVNLVPIMACRIYSSTYTDGDRNIIF